MSNFPSAKVIEDSVNNLGTRLTTMEIETHRFVLSEFNTHRVFSRNSASSRAIPFPKQIDRLNKLGPAYPLVWPAEKSGMQGGEDLDEVTIEAIRKQWLEICKITVQFASIFNQVGLHKSVTNRILEPYMRHKIIVTSTAWQNFFQLRNHFMAQPEIREVARLMEEAYFDSIPHKLRDGEWHMPYISDEERENNDLVTLRKVSSARCARVSHLTHDGVRDLNADLNLYYRLTSSEPMHSSPLEHVATPWLENYQGDSVFFRDEENEGYRITTHHLPKIGNLPGWRSLRVQVEAQTGRTTYK